MEVTAKMGVRGRSSAVPFYVVAAVSPFHSIPLFHPNEVSVHSVVRGALFHLGALLLYVMSGPESGPPSTQFTESFSFSLFPFPSLTFWRASFSFHIKISLLQLGQGRMEEEDRQTRRSVSPLKSPQHLYSPFSAINSLHVRPRGPTLNLTLRYRKHCPFSQPRSRLTDDVDGRARALSSE